MTASKPEYGFAVVRSFSPFPLMGERCECRRCDVDEDDASVEYRCAMLTEASSWALACRIALLEQV
jgi:hypothetical protein